MKSDVSNKWLTAISVFTGTVMSTIDTFILYIAYPHLRGVFSATVSEISWVNTSYSVSALVCMLLAGWLCDHFGRKNIYQAGLVIFVASSLLCGLSSSLMFLIFARILQGVGAGILLPVENTILRKVFPPHEHSRVMGVYGATVMVGPALGPLLGGIIIDNFHWSALFYVNIPVGLIGLIMVQQYVPLDVAVKSHAEEKFDWLGIIYLIIGIFSLIWLLERGDRLYWFETFSNTLLLLSSISFLSLFCAHELMVEKPAVDLRVLQNRVFRATVSLNFLLGFVVTATLFILPIYMQEVLLFTPTQAGETLSPRALFMMIVFPVFGFIFNKFNAKVMVCTGMLVGFVSAICMSKFTHETGGHDMIFPQILQGLAVVLVLIPLTTLGLKSVRPEQLAAAAGLDSVSRQIGGSLGIAVFASLLTHFEETFWGVLRHNISLAFTVFYKRFSDLIVFFELSGSSHVIAKQEATFLLNYRVHEQVLVVTYMNIFQIISFIFLFMFIFTLIVNFDKGKELKNNG